MPQGWESARAVAETPDDWVCGFVEEARKRNVRRPGALLPVSHEEYKEKWYRFCDDFLAKS
ncbi:hypothetical protein [Acetatifactor aquisgranensis]|uniref:hypothetical protein n=1 Tax=Acetatifactor aquisgranensis TaxID=2941233 RepID=UPI00203B9BCE|nr:hypothetical protein [Acetatifactor aquisgranensis]